MNNELRVKLWDLINEYVAACGGDPSKHVYGNTTRQRLVVDIERLIDSSKVIPEDVHHWLKTAHFRGTSSETIVSVLYDVPIVSSLGYPHDADDFGRCVRLLAECPSVAARFHEMRDVSTIWRGLVDEWDTLVTLMKQDDDVSMALWKASTLRDYAHGPQPQSLCTAKIRDIIRQNQPNRAFVAQRKP